jgi:transposase
LLRTGKFTETHLPQGVYAELQTGYTAYLRLHRDRGRQVTLLRNTVRQLFPEFEQVFKDVSGFTATAVIAAGLNPRLISTQSPSEFVANVRANFQGERLALRQVQALYAWAPYSQGLPEATTALALMAQHQAETIRLLDAQAQQVHQPLLNLFHTLPEAPYLLSIQGLQDTNGLALVACSGDLTQYASGAALIKLAGTAPTPNTSGRKRYSLTPFSHQGRSDLRTVLYFITLRLITQNDALYYHYQRLTTRTPRPSPKMQALGACMNKLLWYAWHVVKHCEMYDPDRWRLLA